MNKKELISIMIPQDFSKSFDITKVAKAQPDKPYSEQEAPYFRDVQIWDCIEKIREHEGIKVFNTFPVFSYIDAVVDPDDEVTYINQDQQWIFNNFTNLCYNPECWEVFYYDKENNMFFIRHKVHGYVITYTPNDKDSIKFRLITVGSKLAIKRIKENFEDGKIDGKSFARQYTSAHEPLIYTICVGLIGKTPEVMEE